MPHAPIWIPRRTSNSISFSSATAIRGLLRPFGLKVGPISTGQFDARIRELVAGMAKLEAIIGASDGIFTLSHKALEELLSFGKHTTADKIADAIIFAIRRINYERQDNTTVGVVKIS